MSDLPADISLSVAPQFGIVNLSLDNLISLTLSGNKATSEKLKEIFEGLKSADAVIKPLTNENFLRLVFGVIDSNKYKKTTTTRAFGFQRKVEFDNTLV